MKPRRQHGLGLDFPDFFQASVRCLDQRFPVQTGVPDHVPANGNCGVSEQDVRPAHDLVGYEYDDVVHFSQSHQRVHVLVQFLLPVRQCSPSNVFRPELRCQRVDDHQLDVFFPNHFSRFFRQQHLVVCVVRSSDENVFHHFFDVQSLGFGDGCDAFRPEAVLAVDPQHVSVQSAFFFRQLRHDRQLEAPLRLSGSHLAVDFGDALRFDAAADERVQFLASRAHLSDRQPSLRDLVRGLVAHFERFSRCVDGFRRGQFSQVRDFHQFHWACYGDAFHGLVSGFDQFFRALRSDSRKVGDRLHFLFFHDCYGFGCVHLKNTSFLFSPKPPYGRNWAVVCRLPALNGEPILAENAVQRFLNGGGSGSPVVFLGSIPSRRFSR